MKLYAHQERSLDFLEPRPEVFDTSEPGTGKTLVHLLDFARRHAKHGRPGLVIATKSLLQSAWANDAANFVPDLRTVVARAENREKAFETDAALYITNHDAVKWLVANKPKVMNSLAHFIVDESTAFKHASSQRSKAIIKVRDKIPVTRLLTGTPDPNGVLDLWHQALLLDKGKRLGTSYFKFRNAVCDAVQTGPRPEHVEWVQRDGAQAAIAALLQDIVIRHELRACVDMPEQITTCKVFTLSSKHKAIYDKMAKDMLVDINNKTVLALNGAVLTTKLLQIASGSVYGLEDEVSIDTQRYELVLDLVQERRHSVVLFLWGHQKRALIQQAQARGLRYAYIDGSVSSKERDGIVERYQAGFLDVLFGHPASMGHGLTLTRGVATIWASPTSNLEWFEQANRRIFRIGQTQRTETIVVVAKDTYDEKAYANCLNKASDSRDLFNELRKYA